MKEGDKQQRAPVEVYRASGEFDAQLICSFLDSHGIESFIEGESTRLTHGFTLNELGLARVLVRAEDASEGRRLLEERKIEVTEDMTD